MGKRIVKQVIRGRNAIDGAGVHLKRVIGYENVNDFDPFLMLDGFDSHNPEDYIKGFPWHPHRGIETVTFLLKGEIEHSDSLGNKGYIRELDCQWMTAGSGIIHQEMPLPADWLLGCQIWVNLPAKDKMTEPAYRDITHNDLVVIEEENALIRIISGQYKGHKGAFTGDYVKVQYIEVTLQPNASWIYNETPNDETLFIYLIEGTLAHSDAPTVYEEKACAMLFGSNSDANEANDQVQVFAGENGARFILLAAKPLDEPVVWGGPIVMNTREELDLAFDELDDGTFIKHKI